MAPSSPACAAIDRNAAMHAPCLEDGKRVVDVARANECAFRSPDEVRAGLTHVARAMRASIERGLATRGALPTGALERRAPDQAQALASVDAAPRERCAV